MDHKLISKFKEGKKEAFEVLFNSFYQPLCGFAHTYINDTYQSEDFVQEVFISLWNYREKFDDIISLKTFLYKSVRNKCLNHIKHLKVTDNYQLKKLNEIENDIFHYDHVIEEETHRLIYETIDELPPNCKKILMLSINGLKNPEIAAELSISVNTVKTQKKIAYKHLKIKLKDIYLLAGILLGRFI